MSSIAIRPPTEVAGHVAATIDDIFAMIDGWRAVLEHGLSQDGALAAATVDPLVESFAVPAVSGGTLLTGAGFVATPGTLRDAEWHLAWWLGGSGVERAVRRLATIDDPSHEQFRDYTGLEWWRVPAQTGSRHLTGPYVDYVCTDDYTVTITTPVMVQGAMVGVVGADALVDRLERELLPAMRSGGTPATLVNASGRVVTSTDARREPGAILRGEGLIEAVRNAGESPVMLRSGAAVLACGDTSLALVIGV
ncbi:cache domain-containing protein [Microbacterium sulfonylureivorans]|uniref:cache domain-containing protein n=1 Tax=Microbacterium sulfonylureivorans TaxID=2486854 RepID=UPI000FD89607|nr:cache domain-containing protein [Microbacterium sulfonylureivorans]